MNWLHKRFMSRPGISGSGDIFIRHQKWKIGKLAETIQWALDNSPWYRAKLHHEETGRIISQLKSIAGTDIVPLSKNGSYSATNEAESMQAASAALLSELQPFTFPQELAENSYSFLAVGQDEIEGIVSVPTSGTSGKVKRIFSTAADLEETVSFFEYGMRILVSPARDRVALAMSQARPGNVAYLLGEAMARWNIPFSAHGFAPRDENEEKHWLEELAAWKPTCLVGVPPQMLAVSRHEKARLLNNLSTILLSGDVAEDRVIQELENNFPACRAFRHYGLTECGLGGAVECRQRQWPHLRDDLWVEIIGSDGLPLPPGRTGEICITPLTRRGMPLLRYRTGDEGLIFPEACFCGSWLPRLKTLGRINDRIYLPGGEAIRVSDFETPLFGLDFVRDYDLCLEADGKIEIKVWASGRIPANAEEIVSGRVRNWLGKRGERFIPSIKIEKESNSPQRASGGKRRLIRQ